MFILDAVRRDVNLRRPQASLTMAAVPSRLPNPPRGAASSAGSSRGTRGTGATCRGGGPRTRITSSCPRSCSSRRRWIECAEVPRVPRSLPDFRGSGRRAPADAEDLVSAGVQHSPVRLQAIARETLAEYGGRLPDDARALEHDRDRALHGRRHPLVRLSAEAALVDTNVRRVLGRMFLGRGASTGSAGEGHWDSRSAASERRAYDYNQALMDFGATWCTARAPVLPLHDEELLPDGAGGSGADRGGGPRPAIPRREGRGDGSARGQGGDRHGRRNRDRPRDRGALRVEGARVVVFGRRQGRSRRSSGDHQGRRQGTAVPGDVGIEADAQRLVGPPARAGGVEPRQLRGVRVRAPLIEITPAEFAEVLRINLVGAFVLTKAVVPAMRARGGGSIVHIGSALGTVAAPDFAPYVASKGGLHQFARAAAVELVQDEIRVNVVAPGTIDTPIGQGVPEFRPASAQAPHPDRARRPSGRHREHVRLPRLRCRPLRHRRRVRGRRRLDGVLTPVLVAAAVIQRDGKILIARRPAGKHLAGFWEFPGGKVSPGESPHRCPSTRDPGGARRAPRGRRCARRRRLAVSGQDGAAAVLPLRDRGRAAGARGPGDRVGLARRAVGLRVPARRRAAARRS